MRRLSAVLIVGTLALAGCGQSKPTLTPKESSAIADINLAFAMNALDGSHYSEVLKGVDQLVALCRAKRDALYTAGKQPVTVKQVLEDDANTIRRYDHEVAAELETVTRTDCT